ncbi:sugar transferase [Leuconostoc citreum]|uniref:sugar transferase n=1 Tax=Leuconostoc citreum TaxID=33964 RepID=UPI000EC82BC4|nr:sugar transferase [Leuconostoc citreum]MCJ2166617.1 sugar transferase [Leuconostoc citreum]MCT3071893.1 sugar transferase [Leuconostoc citreum]MDY5161985.1 sugar transferase [Leuconostoc citreum]MDY5165537.1 sugar transferase [Leuconostoc citreum]QEA36648.1 sugar transferase [Leuconostoc citreum]
MGLYRKVVKRLIDTTVAIIFGIVLIVPLFIVAILIKLTSKGPIFFKQERYGKNSVPFTLYKFRSMKVLAPEKSNQKFDDMDQYLTTVGRFLRKTSLDELPQLINVIYGEMSLIGPRPLARTDLPVIEARKLSGADQIKPGITGWAQVNGRNNITDAEKSQFDNYYARNISFRLDFKISILTIFHVFLRTGINNEGTKVDNNE